MRKPPESPDAWAAYQRGLWHLEKATINDDALAEMRWPIGSFARPLISRNDQARADFTDARALYHEIGDKHGEADVLVGAAIWRAS
jgi:hypothetical protein